MPAREVADRPAVETEPSGPSLTRLATRAVRVLAARVEHVVRADGITLDQWLVMEALAEHHALTMADLAAQTMATGPTLTRVVDRLVSTAAAYREVDAHDRRRVRVYLSARGRRLYRRIASKVRDVEREFLDQSDDPGATIKLLDEWANTSV
jgi:DNA-binding MarR family transcriptional regulator